MKETASNNVDDQCKYLQRERNVVDRRIMACVDQFHFPVGIVDLVNVRSIRSNEDLDKQVQRE